MHKPFVACLAISFAAPAFAGGMAEPAPSPVIAAPQVSAGTDWSGTYAGLQYETIMSGDSTLGTTATVEGDLYGAFLGYRHDLGRFVLGAEIDYMVGDGTYDAGLLGTVSVDFDRLVRVGAEGGFDMGRALVYGTIGYADIKFSDPGLTNSSGGYFYGIGVDFLATEKITIGGEILQHKFSDFSAAGDVELLTAGVNAAFRF